MIPTERSLMDRNEKTCTAERVAELEAENAALTKALTGLTCGGSEFFVRRGDRYTADIEACVGWVRRTKEDAHRRTMQALRRAHAAEAALALAKTSSPKAEGDSHGR